MPQDRPHPYDTSMTAAHPTASPRMRHDRRWLTLLLLVVPVVVMFAPALFTSRTFAFRDGAHFYHPLFQWIAGEWGAGRVPLWNPQENCGVPVLADATSSIFYPGKLLFVLPLPFAWLYNVYIVAHVLLAAATMYFLARRMKASEPAAVIVAIAYACGGNVVFQYCNVVFLVGAAWLPAALLCIEAIVDSRSLRAMLWLALVLALMILGGDPQMAYHALLAAGLRLLFAWFTNSTLPVETESKLAVEQSPAPTAAWWIPVPLFAGAAVLAFLLAAVQILPSSEATKSSERAAYNRPRNVYEAAAALTKTRENASLLAETPSEAVVAGLLGQPEPTSHQDRLYNYSISPWRAIEFIWPNISGKPFPTNRRWTALIPGDSQPWTPTMYLGLLPVLAGAVALRFWRTTPTTRWLSTLVLVFALGSLGWYGLGWLWREFYATVLKGDPRQLSLGSPVGGVYWLMVTLLPTYVYFRYPAKLMVVAICALCALAAPQIDSLTAQRSPRWTKALQWLAYASAALAFSAWIGLALLQRLPIPPHPTFGPADLAGLRWDVIGGLLHTAIVAWLLQWLIHRGWDRASEDSSPSPHWNWTLAGLTATELVVANAWLIITAPAGMWTETEPIARAMEASAASQPRFYRGSYHTWHPASFRATSSRSRLQELARWEHDSAFPKYHLQAGVALVESYGSLKSLDYESLLLIAREVSATKAGDASLPTPSVLRLLGAEYLILPAGADLPFADQIQPPADSNWPENVSLWRMKRTMPRAWLVPRVVQLPPLQNPLDIVAVDQRSRDVLLAEVDGKPAIRDFREVAVVETTAPLTPELLEPDASFTELPSCELVNVAPERLRIRTSLSQPGLLVLADSFSPNWIAWATERSSADSQEAPTVRRELTIHRTNRCFRGVELPAGDWLVEFEYRPNRFYFGLVASVLAWLFTGIGLASTVWIKAVHQVK